eukprot:TRINITY_DN10901_c0_g1_i2.p1 TRINITY_DN10901_c0_g1~~TRINITY_DN10901_c0_g1_i2.p1  ORF type:complete len:223 (-),score=16.28 TRINITY_DN10901_c0_g1_i2:8-676(-)
MGEAVRAVSPLPPLSYEIEDIYFDTKHGSVHALACGPEAGPVVVCLHGWGKDTGAKNWAYLMEPLAVQRFRVVAPDFPGFGKTPGTRFSARSEHNCDANGAVDLLHEIIELIGPARVKIIGMSWGGGVAISYALTFRGRVHQMALLMPSFTDSPPQLHKLNVPVQLLWFQQDIIHPIAQAKHYVEQLPRCSPLIHLGGGKRVVHYEDHANDIIRNISSFFIA